MNLSDEQLMIAVSNGDVGAFEQIVIRYQQLAWRIAYRYVGNYSDAEEIAQEAFLKILDSAGSYRPSAKFSTYLYKVVANVCLDYSRKKKAWLTDDFFTDKKSADTPEKHQQVRERDQSIQSAVDSLPARQRVAVILRYYENLSYHEIAVSMDTSVKAIERLLGRAREKLETSLADFFKK